MNTHIPYTVHKMMRFAQLRHGRMAMHSTLFPLTRPITTRVKQITYKFIDFHVSVLHRCVYGGVLIGGVVGGICGMSEGIQLQRWSVPTDGVQSTFRSIVMGLLYGIPFAGAYSIFGGVAGGVFGLVFGLGFPIMIPYGVYMGGSYVTKNAMKLIENAE